MAIGAARGLSFLHEAEQQVIYRDFKASNILLDGVWTRLVIHVSESDQPDRPSVPIFIDNLLHFWMQEFNAKLSDFGLAKAGPTGDRTHVSTQVMGTHGYAAPEYVATGQSVQTHNANFVSLFLSFIYPCV